MLNETFSVVFKYRVEQLITQQIWTFYQSKHQPRLQRGDVSRKHRLKLQIIVEYKKEREKMLDK